MQIDKIKQIRHLGALWRSEGIQQPAKTKFEHAKKSTSAKNLGSCAGMMLKAQAPKRPKLGQESFST